MDNTHHSSIYWSFIEVSATYRNIKFYVKYFLNIIVNQSTNQKRKLLEVMFEKITIKDRKIEYTYKKPFCYFAKCNLNNTDEVVEYIKDCVKY